MPTITIELRNVSYNERLSQETYAYAADIYANGIKVGTASNSGHGGQTDVRFAEAALGGMVSDYIKSLPNVSQYEPVEAFMDSLLSKWLVRRDAKRCVTGKLALIKDGKLMTMSTKNATPAQIEATRAKYAAQGIKFLNEDEVYAFMLAAQEAQLAH
jgi:hypothetical protein